MLSPDIEALRALSTPCLVVDREALDRNIECMAAAARTADTTLRPHAKTHKSPDIAALQLRNGAASRTIGICCATVAETEVMADAGIGGLLLTAPVMGAARFTRLARVNRAHGLTVAIDHPTQLEGLLATIEPGDRRLGVVIDVDVGQARTGITNIGAGVQLALMIGGRSEIELVGIQGFAGHALHIVDPAERQAAAARAATTLHAFAKALAEAGLPPGIITGSGTGTFALDVGGPYTELQVGSYVFMDADYARLDYAPGQALPFTPSLFVLATVVSSNRLGQVTIDAGTKALATNGPLPAVIVGAPAGASYRFAGDEHGIIVLPPGAPAPPLGTRLLIGATHCDPTVNLHAAYWVVKDGAVEKWPIRGRYGD